MTTGKVQTTVPDWFHEAMVDHVFSVDATISSHAAKTATEIESVKLELCKLQQQQHNNSSCSAHDSSNAGGDVIKHLGRRVEEIAESLQHQQCTVQEVLGWMVSLVQATNLAKRRCDDADGCLQNVLNSMNIATKDKPDYPGVSRPAPNVHSDQSRGSEHQQKQAFKECRELEATISAKLDTDEKVMKSFVEDQVQIVQAFAVELEARIKQCDVRMDCITEASETVKGVLRQTVQAVKTIRWELANEKKYSNKLTGFLRKTKKKQDAEFYNLGEVDEHLMEALEGVERMVSFVDRSRLKSLASVQTFQSHEGDPIRMVLDDQANEKSTSSFGLDSFKLTGLKLKKQMTGTWAPTNSTLNWSSNRTNPLPGTLRGMEEKGATRASL